MRKLKVLWQRFCGTFSKGGVDEDFAAELESHILMHIEDNIRGGMDPVEARRQALVKLGGLEQTIQSYREANSLPTLDSLVQDVRYGMRAMIRNWQFTVTAVSTLAIGIGATTAIFSLVDAVLLRPLPYHDPEHLVSVFEDHSASGWPRKAISPGAYFTIKAQTQIFEDVAAVDTHADSLAGGATEPKALIGGEATHNLFEVLGVKPILGRAFLPEEDIHGNDHVLLLSYGLWKERFAGSPLVLGQAVRLNGESYNVIGVMPAGFSFPEQDIELWTPRPFTAADPTNHLEHYLQLAGRLRPGVSLEQANARLQILGRQTSEQYPEVARDLSRFFAEGMQETYTRDSRRALLFIMAAVGFILLIACVNIANLLLGARNSETAGNCTSSRARCRSQAASSAVSHRECFVVARSGLRWNSPRLGQFCFSEAADSD